MMCFFHVPLFIAFDYIYNALLRQWVTKANEKGDKVEKQYSTLP